MSEKSEKAEEKKENENTKTASKDNFYIILTILASIVLFTNLGNIYLWQDEAETALLAKTILQKGYPSAMLDDRIISQREDNSDYNENYVWVWHTWLPFYLEAASFALFGYTTFAARFPFALLGAVFFLVSYHFFKKIFDNLFYAKLTTLLMLINVPLLLHIRQARYYAPSLLFPMIALYVYFEMLGGNLSQKNKVLFILATAALFHTYYIGFFILLIVMVTHLAFEKKLSEHKNTLISLGIVIALFTLPSFIYMRLWDRGDSTTHGFSQTMIFLHNFLLHINHFVMPIFALLLYTVFVYVKRKEKNVLVYAGVFLLLIFFLRSTPSLTHMVLSFILFIVAIPFWLYNIYLSVQKSNSTQDVFDRFSLLFIIISLYMYSFLMVAPFFRYILGMIPFLLYFVARGLQNLFSTNKALVFVIVVMLFASNAFSIVIMAPFNLGNKSEQQARFYEVRYLATLKNIFITSLPYGFLKELTGDYDGSNEAVAEYLKKNAKDGDQVLIGYGDLPLRFYCAHLDVINKKNLVTRSPEWIVGRSLPISPGDNIFDTYFKNVDYTMEDLKVSNDVFWDNRPSPLEHNFETVKKYSQSVYVGKKEG